MRECFSPEPESRAQVPDPGGSSRSRPSVHARTLRSIQEEILGELTSRAASLDEVDLARVDQLIAERLGTS